MYMCLYIMCIHTVYVCMYVSSKLKIVQHYSVYSIYRDRYTLIFISIR